MCRLCEESNYERTIQKEYLYKKYTLMFQFYLSKPVDEILKNKNLHHVQMFKEFLFFDDEEEYLLGWKPVSQVKDKNIENNHIQPFLRDIKVFNKLKTVYESKTKQPIHYFEKAMRRKPNVLVIPHERKIQESDIFSQEVENKQDQGEFMINHEKQLQNQGSFLQDVERHCGLGEISFETNIHDIYDPDYSSDSKNSITKIQGSPEKKVTQVTKQKSSDLDLFTQQQIPKYVIDNLSKVRKINSSSHTSVKKSFDTFGSTHYSQNTSKKIDVQSNNKRTKKIIPSLSQVKQLNQKSLAFLDTKNSLMPRSLLSMSSKNFLNIQIEHVLTKNGSLKLIQKTHQSQKLQSQSSCSILDVKQFCGILQREQFNDLSKVRDRGSQKEIRSDLKISRTKSFMNYTEPFQPSSLSLNQDKTLNQNQNKSKTKLRQNIQTQNFASQIQEMLQSSFNASNLKTQQQTQQKTLNQDQQISLKQLLQKYQKYISVSSITGSPNIKSPNYFSNQTTPCPQNIIPQNRMDQLTMMKYEQKFPLEAFYQKGSVVPKKIPKNQQFQLQKTSNKEKKTEPQILERKIFQNQK